VAALALLAPAAAPRPTAGTVAAGDSAGSAGPFGGKGLFTAWDASSALRAAGKVRWVAVDPSTTTDRQVGELRAAGLEIMVWQPLATQAGVAAVRHYGAAGYIAQAETPAELAAAEAVASSLTVPKALVSNNFLDRYPAGWIAMPEAYENEASYISVGAVVADARARGASVIVPVIGVFNPATPGSVKLPASAYAPSLATVATPGAAAYLAEEMDAADLDAFAAAGAVPAAPTSTIANTGLPTIVGTAQQGQTLQATNGTWAGNPTAFTYQWYVGRIAVPGATFPSYTPTLADVGKRVIVLVRASDGIGSATAQSDESAIVAPSGFDAVTASYCCGSVTAAADGELNADLRGPFPSGPTNDSAYAIRLFGGAFGIAGPVAVHDRLRISAGYEPLATLPVLQVYDVPGALVYGLYVDSSLGLHLYSPPGGLRATSIDRPVGVRVPLDSDRTQPLDVVVTAEANSAVTVAVGGVVRVRVGGLEGATTGSQQLLRVGIIGYGGGRNTATEVSVLHSGVSATSVPRQAARLTRPVSAVPKASSRGRVAKPRPRPAP